jgi:DNA-binding response OmpR family regulator
MKPKEPEERALKHVLIIDDDIHIGNMLEERLTKEGYAVSRAYSGTEAVLVLSKLKPDLILLDLMLPGLSGEEVLQHIKGIPVIVVSAKVDMDSKVELLLGGAADYVTKPFEMKELLARMAVQFRKASDPGQASTLTFDDIVLDVNTHVATVAGHEIKLTRTEFAILKLLMQAPSQVMTKSQVLDSLGEDTPDCTESSLKTHISHLRGKLRDAGGKEYIEAVWGIGFKMKENEKEKEN